MDKQKQIIISHPTGNANTRHAVLGLKKSGQLLWFFTCIAVFKDSWLYVISHIPILKEFRRRMFDASLQGQTKTFPIKELSRLIAGKISLFRGCTIDEVHHDLDSKVAKYIHKYIKSVDAVYAYDEGAYISFKQAHKDGITCLFDLPIIHWRTYQRLLEDEKTKNPEWANILGVFSDPKDKLLRKDEELKMADAIFVASSFTKRSILQDFPYEVKAPIYVIPYGFPDIFEQRTYESAKNRKLKFLYVGRLSQSKGLSYLFEAIKPFKADIELTIVGTKLGYNENLEQNLEEHTYIPYLQHDDVLELMRTQDVFVFPSLFEGFGMVVTEAMSQGTPVIATDKTCAVDFIQNGVNGWIVESASTYSLSNAIKGVLANRDKLGIVGRAAMHTAAQRPWRKYEEELAGSIRNFLNDKE